MKILLCILGTVTMILFYGNAFAEPVEDYTRIIHSMGEEFENVFEALGEGFEEEGNVSLEEIEALVEKITAEAESIVALGKQNKQTNWVFEASAMIDVLEESLDSLEEQDFGEGIHRLGKAFHIFNVLQMINPQFARNEMTTRYQEMTALVSKLADEETAEVAENMAEHLEDTAKKVYYASQIFGKKIWMKFAEAALQAADEVADACDARDQSAAEAALKELEKSIEMLEKLIK